MIVTAYRVILRYGFPVSSGGGSFHCSVIDVSLTDTIVGMGMSENQMSEKAGIDVSILAFKLRLCTFDNPPALCVCIRNSHSVQNLVHFCCFK